jgi:hypothetical protein
MGVGGGWGMRTTPFREKKSSDVDRENPLHRTKSLKLTVKARPGF